MTEIINSIKRTYNKAISSLFVLFIALFYMPRRYITPTGYVFEHPDDWFKRWGFFSKCLNKLMFKEVER